MKQFVVIGLGRFGSSIARTLYNLGYDVLGIDNNEEIIQALADSITHAVQADATDENTLKALGVRNFDVGIVSIGQDIQASILVTLILKELGIKFVVAKAQSELHGKVLYKIGADRVVFPERDMGVRVAHNLVSSNILDYIELSPDFSIVEIAAIPEWFEKSLRELDMRVKHGLNVMAIKRNEEVIVSPKADDIILEGDILVVVGQNKDIEKLEKHV
ncbi:MAG: trk/ktr system potassium uptake protein [Thermoanaerobacteraceae bacterium]|uniref:TrkA family potassium uptake protein n=1 Tax=Biomaibacter acetigenes TaxID=2316383 RepID=A0A3G2R5Q8_9FIRM|nr:TrkA family potassium uptake protein [Biomaibacter acetigenes]MDK2879025.1 trk/ktr system potassium uptake protein [Thermoanaerobacteraceae bacterium]RKL61545.1 TrkA family potassium uptake protein [Thermoanaerobacteraceae bacterium SP2]AYO30780.1 TrkA family potassium uptake protein [Biomaibacter acetigenes]MDN5302539.1 trk/ktr system potassium uptake protein [Thermoanaerobacteraceae bacterium]MDN5312452.1 trk/ktr system potassium uptake protein [Thermoanaerobacteraceae bacterium]